MIVAIDGPAGSGKSTVADRIAAKLAFSKLDTGAMFRTVAYAASARGVDLDDEGAVCALAGALDIRFEDGDDGLRVLADGADVTSQIRTPEVDRIVSKVSAYPGVRRALLAAQRAFSEGRDVVAEGRDIGTVVFPDAQVKVFLTADARERARRRVLQRHGGQAPDAGSFELEVAETLADIERRDRIDSQRASAPLRAAPDAERIDSTSHTIDEIVDMIVDLVNSRS